MCSSDLCATGRSRPSILTTARSVTGSAPTSLPGNVRPSSAGRDPMSSRDGANGDAGDLDGLAGGNLDDARRERPRQRRRQAARDDDRGPAAKCLDRASVEVVAVPVGDEDQVRLERFRIRHGAVALQRADPPSKEWVREDPDPGHLDENRRVPEEGDVDRRSFRRRWVHSHVPGPAAGGPDGAGASPGRRARRRRSSRPGPSSCRRSSGPCLSPRA